MDRRDFLATIGTGATVVLAGCDGQDGTTPTADAGGPDDQTPTASSDGSTPDGGSQPTGTASSSESVTLGDVELQSSSSHRFRIELTDPEGSQEDVVVEGRFNGGNFVSSMTANGETFETYHVDGSSYVVTGQGCVESGQMNQQTNVDAGEWANTEDTEENLRAWGDVVAQGQTTIDGEQMHVFEVDPDDRSIENTYTYYIGVQTGYLRRLESEGVRVDYWDWGQVDAIQVPC